MANILDFGGIDDGVTPNDAAFAAAMASMPGPSKCVSFPIKNRGVYVFANRIVVTYPTGQGSQGCGMTFRGDGSRVSILQFPNANGGIKLIAGDYRQAFHFDRLSITTGQAPSTAGIAVELVGWNVAMPTTPWSDFFDVSISGDDISGYSFAHGWAVDVKVHQWSCINYNGLNTWGAGGIGKGVVIEGDSAAQTYSVAHNFHMCAFNNSDVGFTYGAFVQGVTFNQCGFAGGSQGSAGIATAPAAPGSILAGLSIVNTGFNTGGHQIVLQTTIDQLCLGFSTISTTTTGALGLYLFGSHLSSVVGNSFNAYGSNNQAVSIGTPGNAAFVANSMAGFPLNIGMATGASGISAGWNVYVGGGVNVNKSNSPNPGTPQP